MTKDMAIDILRGDVLGTNEQTHEAVVMAIKALKEQVRVDAVEIVRCKDCKYVGTDATCCLVCKRDGMGLRPFHVYHDDFCSYAERKEE